MIFEKFWGICEKRVMRKFDLGKMMRKYVLRFFFDFNKKKINKNKVSGLKMMEQRIVWGLEYFRLKNDRKIRFLF